MTENKVIIFGIQDYAELAHFYLTNDSGYEVVAFSVNERYIPPIKCLRVYQYCLLKI